jgi:hypothetical protein
MGMPRFGLTLYTAPEFILGEHFEHPRTHSRSHGQQSFPG